MTPGIRTHGTWWDINNRMRGELTSCSDGYLNFAAMHREGDDRQTKIDTGYYMSLLVPCPVKPEGTILFVGVRSSVCLSVRGSFRKIT